MSRQRKRSESYKARRTARKEIKASMLKSQQFDESVLAELEDDIMREQEANYNAIVAAGLRHHG
jgi:hypothetical protein